MKRFEQKLKAQIFFVDDEPEICRVAKNTLEQTGATVKCFANGSECLAQLPSQRCDLLIIDMHMPGMSGIELLVEAKKILPEIPVLIVTGYADTAAARTAMKAGAKHVVEKPVYKKSFLLKVRSLLDKNTGAKQPEEKFSCVSDEESLGKKDTLREQILDAATVLFANAGFRGTSIREITEKAGCNVASVNYHFHGKEKLYAEVFHRQMKIFTRQKTNQINRKLADESHETDLESLIRLFVETFLDPLLTGGSGRELMRLIMQERSDSHLPQGLCISQVIQPARNMMRQSLIDVCPELGQTDAELCLHSIVDQILGLVHTHRLFEGLDENVIPLSYTQRSIEHIVKFSAGGIRQYLNVEKP